MYPRFCLCLLFLFLCAGCQPGVTGSDHPETEKRTFDEFHSIRVSGNVKLTVATGKEEQEVEFTFDDNLMDLVKAEVSDGTLHVSTNELWSSELGLTVTVKTPDIRKIEATKASKISMRELDAEQLELVLSRSSTTNISGKVNSFTLTGSHACNATLIDLRCETATVDLSGASYAIIFATEKVTASASEASTLDVVGNPEELDAKPTGASKINRK